MANESFANKSSGSEDEAVQIVRKYNHLAGARGTTEAHWQEIAQRVMPSYTSSFSSGRTMRTPGDKRNEFLFDSTAPLALNRFGAILDSLLTPRNQTWHRLTASNPYINKDRQVQLWFEDVNRILFDYRYASTANFSSQNQQNYKSLGAFGTGCMFVDELKSDPGLRYKNVHLGEIYFDENHQGIIDEAYRHFPLTARQAIQKFGEGVLPDGIISIAKTFPERQFFFIHCVKPRKDYDSRRKDAKGMPFASYYVSVLGQKMLAVGGFNSFPYAISRYEQVPGEIYGRSPAMDLLPAIKTLNEEKKTILKQGHRIVDPVLLVADDGILDSFSLKPGSTNYGAVSPDGRPLVHTLPTGNVQIGKELMDDERNLINDAFLITLFQILTESPQMTATEVMERTREKGILLAPTIGRQQSEYLGTMIEREVDLLSRQLGSNGRPILPPMPQVLKEAQGEYKIIYDSPLSRAQQAEEAAGLMRTVEQAMNVAAQTQNPEPLDYFNWDEIIPAIAKIQGVPAKWMRSFEDVQSMRQGRQQQNDIQTAIQAGPAAAAMVKAGAVAQKAQPTK